MGNRLTNYLTSGVKHIKDELPENRQKREIRYDITMDLFGQSYLIVLDKIRTLKEKLRT